jgi:hypothetical protein
MASQEILMTDKELAMGESAGGTLPLDAKIMVM